MVNNFGMKKELIIFLLAILAGVTSAWADDNGICGEHLTWEYNTSTGALTISGYGDMDFAGGTAPWSSNNGNIKSISLPDGLTSIGNSAFCFCSLLTSITIPAGVTSIGENAFLGCSGLTSISIPSSVTSIGYQAFSDCTNLNLIDIPASVTGIGDNAFYGCSALAYITIDSNNTVFDSRNDCNAIIETSTNKLIVGCRNTVIPNSVTSIGNFAFFGRSGLNSISIPASVTSIGGSAFQNCSLKSITIPSSVTSIGDYAFYKCTNLKEVYVNWNTPPTPGTDAFKNISFEATLHVPYGTSANYTGASWSGFVNIVQMNPTGQCGDNLFWEYDPTTFILTISGTGEMYDYAYGTKPWYKWQGSITSVVLPDGLTNIGAGAFYGCENLPTIDIPSSVQTIGASAFNSCKALPSIDIPSTVTSIGVSAFANCWVLTSIAIPNGVTAIADNTFNSCKALTSFDIPANVTSIGVAAFMNCQLLESITIPANVTEIGTMAFKDCPQLADIYVGWTSTPPTPENDAFDGLDLSNINLHVPDGTYTTYAATAPWNAFNIVDPYGGKCGANLIWAYNPSTTTLTITGTDAMYNYAAGEAPWYAYKDDIQTVVIESGATTIGKYAFYKCTGLTSVTLPNTIQTIEQSAFNGCNNAALTTINIPTSVTEIRYMAFYKCTGLTSIHIPASVETIIYYAFYGCSGLTSMTVDPLNTHFDSRNDCNAIIKKSNNTLIAGCKNTVIPNTVTAIETCAFAEQNNITAMSIPSSVTNIATGAFYGCPLTDLYVSWDDPSTLTLSSPFQGVTTSNVNLHLPFAAWGNYNAAPWNGFKHVPLVTAKEDPNNADTYYNTFYHSTVAYELPTGVEAYKAKRNGGDLELTKVAEAGDVLPADAAVILKSSVASYELVPSDAGTVTVEDNDLQGVDVATPVATVVTSGTCYVLSGHSSDNTINEVGFYTFSGTLGAHKAYVVIPGASPAPKHLRFVFDGEQTTTDIESPSLQGRSGEASKILRNGQLIIIRNGVEYNANGQMVR